MAEIKYRPELTNFQALRRPPSEQALEAPPDITIQPRGATLRDYSIDVLRGLGMGNYQAGKLYSGLAESTPLGVLDSADQLRRNYQGEPTEVAPGMAALDVILGVMGVPGPKRAAGKAVSSIVDPEAAIQLKVGDKVARVPSRPGDFETSTRGLPRKVPLYHGTGPENRDKILNEGFTQGSSMELSIPGTSISRDPVVSEGFSSAFRPARQAAQEELGLSPKFDFYPGEQRHSLGRLGYEAEAGVEEGFVMVDVPDAVFATVLNLSPADYATRTAKELERFAMVNKPQSYFSEVETFARGSDRTGGQGYLQPRMPSADETERAGNVIAKTLQINQRLTDLQGMMTAGNRVVPTGHNGYLEQTAKRTGRITPAHYRQTLADAADSESRGFRAGWWKNREHIFYDGEDAANLLMEREGKFDYRALEDKFPGWSDDDLRWMAETGRKWRELEKASGAMKDSTTKLLEAKKRIRSAEAIEERVAWETRIGEDPEGRSLVAETTRAEQLRQDAESLRQENTKAMNDAYRAMVRARNDFFEHLKKSRTSKAVKEFQRRRAPDISESSVYEQLTTIDQE